VIGSAINLHLFKERLTVKTSSVSELLRSATFHLLKLPNLLFLPTPARIGTAKVIAEFESARGGAKVFSWPHPQPHSGREG
jgi:hypothetical protein